MANISCIQFHKHCILLTLFMSLFGVAKENVRQAVEQVELIVRTLFPLYFPSAKKIQRNFFHGTKLCMRDGAMAFYLYLNEIECLANVLQLLSFFLVLFFSKKKICKKHGFERSVEHLLMSSVET